MIQVRETVPGAAAATYIMRQLKQLKINDIQLFFDIQARIWLVVQVNYVSGRILLPESYKETKQQPYILWYCKDDTGHAREPNDQDLLDILKVVSRAPKIWAEGEKRADKFEALDAEKDRKHNEKFHDMIHTIAPSMKKALRDKNL